METVQQLIVCGGCNAKIGPGNLGELLADLPKATSEKLLVGFDSTDDAAVIKLREDLAIIQTLDFFPTMVTDPYLFGKIAAANALSDVYAMGGEVLSALNIVAFPEEKDLGILKEILRGGAEKVQEAGAILAGGHSIHDSSVKYGLSVTGTIDPTKIYQNNTCQLGDHLILTKPLGVSIITVGYSAEEISEEAFVKATTSMETLNKYAMAIIRNCEINSCTDVTGFGLAGHLHEMVNGQYSAEIDSARLPYFEEAYQGAKEFILTAGGQRNRNYMEDKIDFQLNDFGIEELLFDPQTSGGLLVSVPADEAAALVAELQAAGIPAQDFGTIIEKQDKELIVY
ncbi:selenide, water dikinase SelD [Enterococcus gilvus]|uniref:Selenide, water dikinase n=1 Tax=Enterococcus gilvus ATCC BAA-350 TaxID=1158614 RepID=R2VKC5_9ENTE|nr:selenide, water dikinase SelD [Enterococcus gilvus]EOI58345.1 selenide, water dikinase [Enterococcus gilvus ATCC BAA-350]EOW79803.1 selenide, water dikinase [Enterococcus gilvus ATCC BAA-350]OJG43368.1 selenide, water dikinase [Enterococcus gilvus]